MKAYKATGGKGIQLHVEETGNPKGKSVLFYSSIENLVLMARSEIDGSAVDFFL